MSINKLYNDNKNKYNPQEEQKNFRPLTDYQIVKKWFDEIAHRFDNNQPDEFVNETIDSIKKQLEKGWKYDHIELVGCTDWESNDPVKKVDIDWNRVCDVIEKSSPINYYFTKNKDLINTYAKLDVIYDAVHPSLIGLALFGITKRIGYKINLYFNGNNKCNVM